MPRETFNPQGESEQREKGLQDLYEEAIKKYEEAPGVPPPEDWATEQITEALDKKAVHQDEKIAEIHRPSGLKSRRISRGWERGHRHGLKKKRPKGGEHIRGQKAA